jgi:hypothetical protein
MRACGLVVPVCVCVSLPLTLSRHSVRQRAPFPTDRYLPSRNPTPTRHSSLRTRRKSAAEPGAWASTSTDLSGSSGSFSDSREREREVARGGRSQPNASSSAFADAESHVHGKDSSMALYEIVLSSVYRVTGSLEEGCVGDRGEWGWIRWKTGHCHQSGRSFPRALWWRSRMSMGMQGRLRERGDWRVAQTA